MAWLSEADAAPTLLESGSQRTNTAFWGEGRESRRRGRAHRWADRNPGRPRPRQTRAAWRPRVGHRFAHGSGWGEARASLDETPTNKKRPRPGARGRTVYQPH
jgi:hypothetical protein